MFDEKTSMLIETYAKHAAFNGAVGLIIASASKTGKIAAATAFVIHGLIADIFKSLATLASGGSDKVPAFYATMLVGNILIDLTAIVAFRRLGIIGDNGAFFVAGMTFITSVNRLYHLIEKLPE